MRVRRFLLRLLAGALCWPGLPAGAAPVQLDLPAQSAATAMVQLSEQARVEIVFPYDELHRVPVPALRARLEPAEAITRILRDTGYAAHRYGRGKYVIRSTARPSGSIRGRVITASGDPAADALVAAAEPRVSARADANGEFLLAALPPGRHRLLVTADTFQPLQIEAVEVEADRVSKLPDQRLRPARDPERMEPYIVEGRSARMRPLDDSAALLGPRRATGNLDLPRSADDALPFAIYTREQITRSGVVALNEFLQRAILEGDASSLPPEQSATFSPTAGIAGSANLKLRGYTEHETVVLVNGRRLPEIQTSWPNQTQPPDVNFIPLSLIQQVEVLPASASALYSGNPIGGVINIVLRPDVNATEVTATYTNAADRYDAPQSSISFQHGQSLLGGALRLRVNAVHTAAEPPTEAELGLRRAHDATRTLTDPLFRATPNVRSADPAGAGLFGPGTAAFTSVAPGATGTGGLAAFAGREGVRNVDFFDSPGDLSASPTSLDAPYGRRQRRAVYFASAAWDPFPWLQLGLDGSHSRTVFNRGLDVLTAELALRPGAPQNPFNQEVVVALAETAPLLGSDYNEVRIEFASAVAGALVRLPGEWRVSLDAQAARNRVDARGLAGADPVRWQELVDAGRYLPLRDTQVHGPPPEFYDRVLIYRGGPGEFVRIGDYTTLDAAVRVSNQALSLPTGRGALNAGADYRRVDLADYREAAVYGDGSLADVPAERTGRTLERYSFFAELQAPLLPPRLLPRWLRSLHGDLAVRHVASANSNEVNTAPTFGLRAELPGGVLLRGSVTTSNRFPTPQLNRPVTAPGGPGGGLNREPIEDPRRGGEDYDVVVDEAIDPGLPPEDAVTQTAGIVFERGDDHRFRASLDFVDTRKSNEILALTARSLVNVEDVFPDRVERGPLAPGDPHPVGRIQRLITGSVNASWRHSQTWNASAEYAWTGWLGGTLELRARYFYYQRFERQLFANSPVVDQLRAPDGTDHDVPLMRHRMNFGAGWSNRRLGFGLDGHYYHSRVLPLAERAAQGADRIKPYWQFDAYVQADLSRWLPWQNERRRLRAQLRVNNLSDFDYPKYAGQDSGTGVQPYGDWRGRTYSLSVTATF
ncbi:MAG TPA: TonB-dependent receptor [Opitutaceae bacterium]|nr:TonB-dependent receptor [Opitutaceae bacterium]